MDYARVSAAGQAAGDVGTNLSITVDQTAPGCVAAARAFPAWATSQALLDVHAAHTESVSGHVESIRATAAHIQTSVGLTAGADNTSARDAAGVVTPGGV